MLFSILHLQFHSHPFPGLCVEHHKYFCSTNTRFYFLVLSISDIPTLDVSTSASGIQNQNFSAVPVFLWLSLPCYKFIAAHCIPPLIYIHLLHFCRSHHVNSAFLSQALYHICLSFQKFHAAEKAFMAISGQLPTMVLGDLFVLWKKIILCTKIIQKWQEFQKQQILFHLLLYRKQIGKPEACVLFLRVLRS